MKHLLLSFLLLFSFLSRGQELAPSIISTAGDAYVNETVQLSWTLGGSLLDSYSDTDITLSSGVQIEDFNPFVLSLIDIENDIDLYPNPVQNQLNLSFNTAVPDYQIVISDLMGRAVYQSFGEHTKQKTIDVSHLSIGSYAVQILSANQRVIKKFKLSKTR